MFETKIGSYVVFTLGLSYISTRIYTLLYECVKCVKLNFHTHAKLQFDQQTLKTILKYQYHFVKGSWLSYPLSQDLYALLEMARK